MVAELLERVREQAGSIPVEELEDLAEEEVEGLNLVYDKERVVGLTKYVDEVYGLQLRGGHIVDAKNEKFIKTKEITPVFVNGVALGTAAARSGKFRVGDVLIAVNDHRLAGLTHEQTVATLHRLSTQNADASEKEFQFIVRYDHFRIHHRILYQ